jgi:hypothetical protein
MVGWLYFVYFSYLGLLCYEGGFENDFDEDSIDGFCGFYAFISKLDI